MIIIPAILKANESVEEGRLRCEVGQPAIDVLDINGLARSSYNKEDRRIYWSLTDKAREMIDGKQ